VNRNKGGIIYIFFLVFTTGWIWFGGQFWHQVVPLYGRIHDNWTWNKNINLKGSLNVSIKKVEFYRSVCCILSLRYLTSFPGLRNRLGRLVTCVDGFWTEPCFKPCFYKIKFYQISFSSNNYEPYKPRNICKMIIGGG
jgi:hypothetical protein